MKTNPLLLNVKRLILIVAAWIVAAVAHNLVSALLGIEEAVFFLLAVIVIPLYLLVSIAYTIYVKVRK